MQNNDYLIDDATKGEEVTNYGSNFTVDEAIKYYCSNQPINTEITENPKSKIIYNIYNLVRYGTYSTHSTHHLIKAMLCDKNLFDVIWVMGDEETRVYLTHSYYIPMLSDLRYDRRSFSLLNGKTGDKQSEEENKAKINSAAILSNKIIENLPKYILELFDYIINNVKFGNINRFDKTSDMKLFNIHCLFGKQYDIDLFSILSCYFEKKSKIDETNHIDLSYIDDIIFDWNVVNLNHYGYHDCFNLCWSNLKKGEGLLSRKKQFIIDYGKFSHHSNGFTDKIFNDVLNQGFDSLKQVMVQALCNNNSLRKDNKEYRRLAEIFSSIKEASYYDTEIAALSALHVCPELIIPKCSDSKIHKVRLAIERYIIDNQTKV